MGAVLPDVQKKSMALCEAMPTSKHRLHRWRCTKSPEPLYGFDRNGCTDSIGIVNWRAGRPIPDQLEDQGS